MFFFLAQLWLLFGFLLVILGVFRRVSIFIYSFFFCCATFGRLVFTVYTYFRRVIFYLYIYGIFCRSRTSHHQ